MGLAVEGRSSLGGQQDAGVVPGEFTVLRGFRKSATLEYTKEITQLK